MAEFHGNEAWGTAIIIPPCSSGSRPAMTAALRLRLSLLVLFLLLLAAERNIEAGIKYLRHLADAYLDDPKLDRTNKTLMAFAAYNAGPGNLLRFRKWAASSGLDPDVWFFNVEEGAARIVGQETVQYVSNIYKYYIAYKLLTDHAAETQKAKEASTTTP